MSFVIDKLACGYAKRRFALLKFISKLAGAVKQYRLLIGQVHCEVSLANPSLSRISNAEINIFANHQRD